MLNESRARCNTAFLFIYCRVLGVHHVGCKSREALVILGGKREAGRASKVRIMLERGARVCGIVMLHEQLLYEHFRGAFVSERLPTRDGLAAVQ